MEETVTAANGHLFATDVAMHPGRMHESDVGWQNGLPSDGEYHLMGDGEDRQHAYDEDDGEWGASPPWMTSSSPSSASSGPSSAIRIIKFKIPGHEENDAPAGGDVNVDILSEISSEPEGANAPPEPRRPKRKVTSSHPLSTSRKIQHLHAGTKPSAAKGRSMAAKVTSPLNTIKSHAKSSTETTSTSINATSTKTPSTASKITPQSITVTKISTSTSKSSSSGSKGAQRIQDLPGYISDMRAFVQEMRSIQLRPWLRIQAELHGVGADPTEPRPKESMPASSPAYITVPVWIRCDGGTSSTRKRTIHRQSTAITPTTTATAMQQNGTTITEGDAIIQLLGSLLKRIPISADEGYLCEVPRCAKLFHEKEKYRRHLHNHVRTIKHQQARNSALSSSYVPAAEVEEEEGEDDAPPPASPLPADGRIPWTVRLYPLQVEASHHIQ